MLEIFVNKTEHLSIQNTKAGVKKVLFRQV